METQDINERKLVTLESPPTKKIGEEALRLQTDITRDELSGTVDEILRRLSPSDALRAGRRTFDEHRGPILAGVAAAAAIAVGVTVVAIRGHRG